VEWVCLGSQCSGYVWDYDSLLFVVDGLPMILRPLIHPVAIATSQMPLQAPMHTRGGGGAGLHSLLSHAMASTSLALALAAVQCKLGNSAETCTSLAGQAWLAAQRSLALRACKFSYQDVTGMRL
jgi:hypothetical protein